MSAAMALPMFWIGLAFKIALTATIVVSASFVVERSGPLFGSLVAALPTAGGAAMIILAIEHDAAFIAQSAVGSMVANALCPIFALVYALLARRHTLLTSLGLAMTVWLVGALLSRFVPWTAATALLANAIVYPLTIYAASRYVGDAERRPKVAVTARDIAWRAAVVAICIAIVTALSSALGSFLAGVFAFIPVALSSFFIILHLRAGGPASASVAAHLQVPLIGLTMAQLSIHLLAERIGVWWALLVAITICVGWNAALWFWKNRGKA